MRSEDELVAKIQEYTNQRNKSWEAARKAHDKNMPAAEERYNRDVVYYAGLISILRWVRNR